MQPHDDKTRLAIANDLGRLLGGIAEDDQRFRPKLPRHCRDQFLETVLGNGAAVGIQPEQVVPRQQPAPHRLDDVHEDEGQTQRLRDTARHLRLMERRG